MAKNFKHLIGETVFPGLDNVNVYDYENTFDYDRWTPDTTVKLCNVNWRDRAPLHAVKFESDAARDSYFDAIPGRSVELTIMQRLLHDGTITVPVPFDECNTYNYLVVDYPIATSEGEPIAYETTEGVRRYFYFIESCFSEAPNTTRLDISVDWWTTFINRVNINSAILERGHYPVVMTDTDTYLENPANNAALLLAPDVGGGEPDRVNSTQFLSLEQGQKLIVALSPMSAATFKTLSAPGAPTDTTAPIFSDATGERWGEDYKVTGYLWGYDVGDYSSVTTPTDPATVTSGILAPIYAYAFTSDTLAPSDLISDLIEFAPQFCQTLQGLIVLDATLVTTVSAGNVSLGQHTYNLMQVLSSKVSLEFELSKDAFNYPDELVRFAKLYTYPYAQLEITDNAGNSHAVRIETISTKAVNVITNVAYPVMQTLAYIEGANSDVNSYHYVIKELGNVAGFIEDKAKTLPVNMELTALQWDIPIYSIVMSGFDSWKLHSANGSRAAGRYNAIKNYQNSIRTINTGEHNTIDSAETGYDNATRSASTASTNALANNATGYGNAVRSANTAKTQNTNSNTTTTTNAAISRALASANTVRGTANAASVTNYQNQLTIAVTNYDIGYNEVSAGVSTTTNAISGVANAIGAGLSGGIGAGIGTAVSTVVGIASDQLLTNAMNNNAENKKTAATNNATQIVELNNDYSEAVTDATNTASQQMTANDVNTSATNATLSQQTATSNASDTKATGDANTGRTLTTANANALDTLQVSTDNAGYTRDAAALNAQTDLVAAQTNAGYTISDRKNDAPIMLGTNSGDPTLDVRGWRGVTINVRTQQPAEIAQAGAEFARYGYTLGQAVDASELCLMDNFTYWQCSDIWLTGGAGTIQIALDRITDMMREGVTVWSDPDKVGKVTIYDN